MNIIKSVLNFIGFIFMIVLNLAYTAFRLLLNYFILTSLTVGLFAFCAWNVNFLVDGYRFWTPTTDIHLIIFRMLCWIASAAWLSVLSNMRIRVGVISDDSQNSQSESKH